MSAQFSRNNANGDQPYIPLRFRTSRTPITLHNRKLFPKRRDPTNTPTLPTKEANELSVRSFCHGVSKLLTARVGQVVAPVCPEVFEVCRNDEVAFNLRVLPQPFALAHAIPYETRREKGIFHEPQRKNRRKNGSRRNATTFYTARTIAFVNSAGTNNGAAA